MVFTPDKRSVGELEGVLRKTQLTDVQYLRDSLMKLGAILRSACQVLDRGGCQIYENYQGFLVADSRPLTQRQEFILKQATIVNVPPNSVVDEFRKFVPEERSRRMDRYEDASMRGSYKLVTAGFDYPEAEKLIVELVVPYISTRFGQFSSRVEGRITY